MDDYIETISNIYNLPSDDFSSTISALLVFGFIVYVAIDAFNNKN
jgi:hypothetical protein